jgi:hypothetical protein
MLPLPNRIIFSLLPSLSSSDCVGTVVNSVDSAVDSVDSGVDSVDSAVDSVDSVDSACG